MDFIASLNDLNNISKKPAKRCAVDCLLEKLPDTEAEALTKALDNPNIRHTDLANLLAENGFGISSRSIMRHRNRKPGTGCSCP